MHKYLLSALAFSFTLSAGSAVAQGKMTKKSDDEKTKVTTDDGMMTKTKIADDGKTKIKSKTPGGAKMKATTKPREAADLADMNRGNSGGVLVGGAMMTPDKDIVENAVNSADHTTLVAAVKAADLVGTLKSDGPFTVFAPTNAAIAKLPAGATDMLMRPENKAKLAAILSYHVVPGRLLAADLQEGQTLTTVEGETLTVQRSGNSVMLRDARGGKATVTVADAVSKNGVTHVIDTVLMPGK